MTVSQFVRWLNPWADPCQDSKTSHAILNIGKTIWNWVHTIDATFKEKSSKLTFFVFLKKVFMEVSDLELNLFSRQPIWPILMLNIWV